MKIKKNNTINNIMYIKCVSIKYFVVFLFVESFYITRNVNTITILFLYKNTFRYEWFVRVICFRLYDNYSEKEEENGKIVQQNRID